MGTYLSRPTYSNGIVLSDNKTLIVTLPLQITGLANAGANPLIIWGSTPGANYQVLVTTNLTQPFQPLGPVITTNGFSASLTTRHRPRRRNFTRLKLCPDLRFKNRFSGRRRGDKSQSSAILQPRLKTPHVVSCFINGLLSGE